MDLWGLNNSVDVSQSLTMLLCVKWKRYWNQICISLGAYEMRPVTGWCGTCESVCQNPGSSILYQLQPGHCRLTEAGKQANTKDLTWWDKGMSKKNKNLDKLPVHRRVKTQREKLILTCSQFRVSSVPGLLVFYWHESKIHTNTHNIQSGNHWATVLLTL